MSKVAWSKPIEWVFHDGSTKNAKFVGKSAAGSFHVETEYGPLFCDEYGAYGIRASGYIRNVQDHSEQETATLRDQFAMAALTGELAQQDENLSDIYNTNEGVTELADWCYIMADAMIEARKKGN